jgi:hypothetical protein
MSRIDFCGVVSVMVARIVQYAREHPFVAVILLGLAGYCWIEFAHYVAKIGMAPLCILYAGAIGLWLWFQKRERIASDIPYTRAEFWQDFRPFVFYAIGSVVSVTTLYLIVRVVLYLIINFTDW